VRVRRANTGDIPALMHLERHSPAAAHWSCEQYQGILGTESGQQGSERLALVAEDDGGGAEQPSTGVPEILAFLIAHRVDAEWELENIVVAPMARRRGVGTRLLGEFVAHARAERGGAVFLEVRESNQTARTLYHKVGFKETGLRKSYYTDPPEDAILCRLSIS
jgi:ribosomal-protein-alanine N-acetyltransferase